MSQEQCCFVLIVRWPMTLVCLFSDTITNHLIKVLSVSLLYCNITLSPIIISILQRGILKLYKYSIPCQISTLFTYLCNYAYTHGSLFYVIIYNLWIVVYFDAHTV